MKTLVLALVALQTAGAPTAAQFNRALADACPAPRTETRNVSCTREEGSIQFSCSYEMRGANGAWTRQTAILQQAEGQWVWIDGPTRCDSEQPELN